jgi:uncharacterized repeat protein (TIGR03803 family)
MKTCISALLVIAAFAAMSGHSRAADLMTLVSFCSLANCADGEGPQAGVIADANGNLFGTTVGGGTGSNNGIPGGGTVFEVAKTASGYASTPLVLHNFCSGDYYFLCGDGKFPEAGLILDAHGNLFGTTLSGGGVPIMFGGDVGTVFEISGTGFNKLAEFNFLSVSFAYGYAPLAGLILDANGNLFGTTSLGGDPSCNPGPPASGGCGTVFEIGGGGFTTLVRFNGTDGASPEAGLILDTNGNLFGTTARGGAHGGGTIFEIAKTSTGYATTPTILYSFCAQTNCADGAVPVAGRFDADGNLFGTTGEGGAYGGGTVFEIVKTASGYASTPTILVSFCSLANCADGAGPAGGVIADANGNLFGTTGGGGASGDGTVFEIVKTSSGYASTPTTLVSFNGTDGAGPAGGVIANANGNLFGTTAEGGAHGGGTVFEITGSGFIPAGVLAGTPGSTNCIGKSVSGLAQEYGTFLNAAITLGYSSRALQNEVMMYCGG